jgi:hypothetical protein
VEKLLNGETMRPMGERVLEFRVEANVDGGQVGSVLIVDGEDPDVIYEQISEFMPRAQAQALAKRFGLPFREVAS